MKKYNYHVLYHTSYWSQDKGVNIQRATTLHKVSLAVSNNVTWFSETVWNPCFLHLKLAKYLTIAQFTINLFHIRLTYLTKDNQQGFPSLATDTFVVFEVVDEGFVSCMVAHFNDYIFYITVCKLGIVERNFLLISCFMFLYIIHFCIMCCLSNIVIFSSEITFYTTYFVLSYSINVVSTFSNNLRVGWPS